VPVPFFKARVANGSEVPRKSTFPALKRTDMFPKALVRYRGPGRSRCFKIFVALDIVSRACNRGTELPKAVTNFGYQVQLRRNMI